MNVLGKILKKFSISKEIEVIKINKDDTETVVTISYNIKFFDSARFMTTSLPNLVDNLTEWTTKIKYKDCNRFLTIQ